MNELATLSLAALAFTACAHESPSARTSSSMPASAAASMSTPDAPFRATKPAAAEGSVKFEAPVPVERTLSNGAKLLVVENHAVPIVAMEVLIGTGADGEPAGKGGLAKFTAAMLSEGTKTRTAPQFAEQTEDLAMVLFPAAGQEHTQIIFNSLTETLPQSLDLLADMLVNPAFRKEDVERERSLLISALEQKQANPQALARDQVAHILYGDKHPWGQPDGGTVKSLSSITVADLRKFHDLYFRPTNTILSVSGDVSADDMVKLLEAKLAAWKKRPRVAVKLPTVKLPTTRTIVLVDKPGASQSQVQLFGPAVPAKDADAVALRVANFILGGPFARLDLNIRENKGYSYGVRGSVNLMKDHGYWSTSGGVKADVTTEALTEFLSELQGFSNGQLKAGELDNARSAVVRSLPSLLERNQSVASAMATLAFNGQPLDYYRTLSSAVDKIDAATVARVAAKYDRPDAWSIVIVGPRAASEQKLGAMKLGAVNVIEVIAPAKGGAAHVQEKKPAAPAAK